MAEDNERSQELAEVVEDLVGNLEMAADQLEKITAVVMPGYVSKDVEEFNRIAEAARKML